MDFFDSAITYYVSKLPNQVLPQSLPRKGYHVRHIHLPLAALKGRYP